VTLASNGLEALAVLQAGPRPDLIILDMLLPLVDGWQFLDRLKRQGPQPPVPVLIATGTILTPQWALANGCRDFLRKPIETGQLLEVVRRCLA
jgi:CheY-like chemotaxis protein